MTNQITAVAPREPKTQIVAGGDVAAIIPRNLDEVWRLSQALAGSGMAPASLKNAEQVMVAIMAGAELGLPPFQAIQSFAVINGRPTMWGDGLVAVARNGGAKIKEWHEGEGDLMVAHCLVTRQDGEEIERTFSVADAKKANLWAKTGPWQQYPKRMLAMRARAFALRDGCADMLRGMQVREEVEDYNGGPIRDVTPTKSGVMARLPGAEKAAGVSANAVEEGIATEQPVEPAHVDEIIEASFEEAPHAPDGSAEPQEAEQPTEAASGAASGQDDSFPGDTPSQAAKAPDEPNKPSGEGSPTLAQRAQAYEDRIRSASGTVKLTALRNASVALRNDLDAQDPDRLAELETLWDETFLARETAEKGGV